MAEIRPHETTKYTYRQSRFFPRVPELPMRAVIVAPSGGGKTTLMVSLILDIMRGAWRRIYIFSPTALLDDAWKPVKGFCEDVLQQDEPCLYDDYDEEILQKIITKHRKIVAMAKQQKKTQLYGALIVIDDHAENSQVVRGSRSLHELYTKGRHYGLSVLSSVQKYRVLAPIIRVNATDLFIFRLRSLAEQQAIVEENSAAYGKDATERILERATEEPYSFLWLNLRATRKEDLFWLKFTARLIPAGRGSADQD
jgi:hypothetical protein